MEILIPVLRVVHILTAILMAWPAYALVAVNQRGRLGAPLGDRADVYMENTIKNRTIPCYVFQATALLSGLALIFARGYGLDALVTNWLLGLKFLLLFVLVGLLSTVTFHFQPRIDALFAQGRDGHLTDADAAQIRALRMRRKQISSLCMFVVLTIAMLGVQVWTPFPLWLTGLLLLAIAAFTWRSYSTYTEWGWV